MELKKYLMILSLLLASNSLGGCATWNWPWAEPEVVERTVYMECKIPVQNRPKPLNLLDVHFDVVTRENLNDYIEQNEIRNGALIFAAIDISDYERLSYNTAEFHRLFGQLYALLDYYESFGEVDESK